jgi:ribosomal protein S18 acetylase RimI-like enzyme
MTDADLYRRSIETLLACWDVYARGSRDAAVRALPGVAAGVFPHEPERAVYNNAILARDLGPAERAGAIAAMESAYASAGVDRFAAWTHETDEGMQAELTGRGYVLSETTRAMAMELTRTAAPAVALEPLDWPEYLRYLWTEIPGLLAGSDPRAFRAVAARQDGEIVAAGISYDHAGDCVIGNVGTEEWARRRGLGTAVTARLVADARARGCVTASLQATPMAERVYAAVGFRDLGRILEFAPAQSS